MAYVNMTKDFSEVRKTIPGLNMTVRQIAAFVAGLIVGLPVFLVMRFFLHMEVTASVMGLAIGAAPIVFCIMYKSNGMGMEKHFRYFYATGRKTTEGGRTNCVSR